MDSRVRGNDARTPRPLAPDPWPPTPPVFDSTTIPILQEIVGFAQARHTVLAGNIANLDTPGYKVRDLALDEFQARLQEAVVERRGARERSMGDPPREAGRRLAQVVRNPQTILRHDLDNVGMEYQVSEMVKNQMQHNLALTLMVKQFRMLETGISGRV
jgi:flagellar basal-body rod protein FlgB